MTVATFNRLIGGFKLRVKYPKDLTGMRFDRLTSIKINENFIQSGKNKYEYWLCVCDCGKEKNVTRGNLLGNKVRSCGCLFKERIITHGMSKTRIYEIWIGMKKRCLDKKFRQYHDYGGRGIKIHEEWLDFSKFMDWSYSNGYNENLSLDRIDNDGDYSPYNCKWSTDIEQANNKRNNVLINFKGKTLTLSQLSRISGINAKTISDRLRSGYENEDLIAKPFSLKKKKKEVKR